MSKFVHLHVHSEYSLLDGLPQIADLVKTAKKNEMDSLALTDHGVMHGAIEFYKEAKKEGVKPIIGMEGYVAVGKTNHHITLLAKNKTGYQNLMKLTSIAHLEGFYYRPRVDHATLKKYSEGLICLSGCPKSELSGSLEEGDLAKAKKIAQWHQNVFGAGNYYLEIQSHEYSHWANQKDLDPKIVDNLSKMAKFESRWKDGVLSLSRELGIPIVATNDVHYAEGKDAFAQDVLVCIATGKNVSEVNRMRYVDTPTFYLKNEAEMKTLFPDLDEALENTQKIAQECDVEIELGKWFFPKIDLPGELTFEEHLKNIVAERFAKKFPQPTGEEQQRLDYELDVINKKGYAPYFLIATDLMDWAHKNGVITTIRGSVAGSLTTYVLGITPVNPLTYNLPFERFLNPSRPSPPDIDFDVADNRREDLINYLVKKYGKDKVAQICTFGRMLARAAVRDVARVLGYPYSVGDRIAKLVPIGSQGFPMTLDRALKESSELKSLFDSDPEAKRVIEVGKTIEGNARHLSVHAAGVVISPETLTNFSPLALDPTSQEKVITQYEMHSCEDVGLIKFDLLGLRNLSILGAAVEIIEKTHHTKIELSRIPLDDQKTFAMLGRGETMGTFQLGGSGMTRYLKELKPSRVEDLMVMVALFRPGPMAVIPEYIARKHNPKLVKYLDPRMQEYLDKSYGMLVYQDDLLYTAIYLAGYTWEEADNFRKAVGKKIPAEMAKQKEKFVQGIIKNGRDERFAETLWALFEPFQAYGFNKAHAACYGLVAYQTAYLKANYPVEFMAALMTAESNDTEKVAQAVYECRKMGIVVEPPDINRSDIGFTLEPNPGSLEGTAIRFGLSAIKNVGDAAISNILSVRDKDFTSLSDFCHRVSTQKVNRKVLESLIRAGAFDQFGRRSAMLSILDKIRGKAEKASKQKASGQSDLFGEADTVDVSIKDDLPLLDEFPKDQLQKDEKELLGFYLSEHPLAAFVSQIENIASHKIVDLDPALQGKDVTVGGMVTSIRILLTKKNSQEMAFGRIEDLSGSSVEITVFPRVFEKSKHLFARDQLVVVLGKVDLRDDQLSVIAQKIFSPSDMEGEASSPPAVEVEFTVPKGTHPQAMLEVSKIFQSHKGSQKVTLIFQNSNGFKRMTLPFGVSLTPELKSHIHSLLGN